MQKYLIHVTSIATTEPCNYWFYHKQDITFLQNSHPSIILTCKQYMVKSLGIHYFWFRTKEE